MNNKIVEWLYKDKIVRDILTNMGIDENDIDDIEQEIYLILLEYSAEKIKEMYDKKQLKYFIVGIVWRQYFSNTSPFFYKYKKYYTIIDENINTETDE
jgi:hypothetical protein